MNLKPLYDRVLVRPISPQEMTKGGIIIPDNAKERSASGVVVAVGPGGYEATKYLLAVSHALVQYLTKEQSLRVALGGIEIVASDFAMALDRSLDDLHFEDMPVRIGDLVMYGKFSGFEVGVEKLQEITGGEVVSETETLVVLRAQEIMLVRPVEMLTQIPEPEVSHVPTESCR